MDAPGSATPPRSATVLLVEDSPELVGFLVAQLEEHYRVLTAADGEAGWEAAREQRPDLIVTDMMMPRRDGLWLIDQVRAHERTRRTPVILLTGHAAEEERARARERGANVYVAKPFRFRELKAAIDGLIEHKRERLASFSHETATSMRVLTAGMAHELLNPLGFISNALYGIQGLVDRVERDGLGAEDVEALRSLGRSARLGVDRIQALVHELRTMARPGAETGPRSVDLNRAVRSTLTLVGLDADPGIEVNLELAPHAAVLGEPGRLGQVLLNLLANAIQALEASGGTLWVRTRRVEEWVDVMIADNGPGIVPEHLDRVFDPFFTTKSPGKGTGLGLALCRQIVEEHGGSLGLDSVAGEGTTVSMRLRAADPDDASDREPLQLELVSS